MDRGTELKAVLHYKTNSSQPHTVTHDHDICPRAISGQRAPSTLGEALCLSRLHCEASQKPALLGLPPVFMLLFEGSLTHQQVANSVARGPLAATCQALQLLLSHSSARWPSPSPRKASCGKKTIPWVEFIWCKIYKHLQQTRHYILQK